MKAQISSSTEMHCMFGIWPFWELAGLLCIYLWDTPGLRLKTRHKPIYTMQTHGGFLKCLSEQQIAAFETFKLRCTEAGLLSRPAALHDGEVEDGLNDDPTLLFVDYPIRHFRDDCTDTMQTIPSRTPIRCTRCPEAIQRGLPHLGNEQCVAIVQ
jgi:hypothetical protein